MATAVGESGEVLRLTQTDWDRLAARARWSQRAKTGAIYAFLIVVSLPVILPYFWLVTIAFSAKTGVAETAVLWRSVLVLVPALLALWIWSLVAKSMRQMAIGSVVIVVAALVPFLILVGPELHLRNFIFIWQTDFVDVVRSRTGEVSGSINFPSVWLAFANSLYLAGAQTIIVATVASLAGYYLSRFQFPARGAMLRSLLVLHAFPVLTLIVPLFLILNYVNMLDTLAGVILVLVGLELPFAIFIMKGFFDAVPDGASRRQAFVQVVLPQVRNGLIAISVFSFIRGWEEYIFVFTFLIKNTNWTMSLYMFFVRDDVMGTDFGVVSAVGVFYLVPSLVMYLAAQQYLMQMSVGGIKG
jgi:inositol-phosphate transport system permease protein